MIVGKFMANEDEETNRAQVFFDAQDREREMKKQEAIVRFRAGRKIWNDWAEYSAGVETDFSHVDFRQYGFSNFAGFIFPGNVTFDSAKFDAVIFNDAEFRGDNIYFSNAEFYGKYTEFNHAQFLGKNASFQDVSFENTSVRFIRTHFFGDVNFGKVKFGDITCAGMKVGGVATFTDAEFLSGKTIFNLMEFEGPVLFDETEFRIDVSFTGAKFCSSVNLENSEFAQVPDFRRTKLEAHFTFHNLKIDDVFTDEKKYKWLGKVKNSSDADKFRRLKEIAIQSRDHERELDFFAKELKAKRFYETKGLSLIPSYLYEWTSDFGRSLWRPIFCLIMTAVYFGELYGVQGLKYATSPLEPLWNGMKLSLAIMVPFAAVSRTALLEARDALFGPDISFWMYFAMVFEGVLAVIFIFLIGLALRNRFRI